MHLGQRGCGLGYVLKDLHRHSRIERTVGQGQIRGVGLVERDVVAALGPFGGDGEHRRCAVDACNRSLAADLVEQLGHVETRAAAHIENTLTRARIERLLDETTPANDVPAVIEHFQLLGHALVELELCHVHRLLPHPAR